MSRPVNSGAAYCTLEPCCAAVNMQALEHVEAGIAFSIGQSQNFGHSYHSDIHDTLFWFWLLRGHADST